MTEPRTKINVSYRIVDATGHTVTVIKRTGYNKRNLQWQVERFVKNKYGIGRMKIHQLKVVEEK